MTQILHPLRLFLCHSSGDKAVVRDLYKRLRADGFDPWLDEENLLPGHDWHLEISAAVRRSDIVLACLSRDSTNKRGYVQREIKHALDVAEEQPGGSIFIIPLKLEECDVPERLSNLQWVNFFEERGYEKLLAALREKSGGPPPDACADQPPAHKGRYSGREILRDLFIGLLFFACVLVIKIAVEQTRPGNQLSLMIYDLLTPSLTTDSLPVTIVDISDLEPEDFNVDGQMVRATPREPLREMIEAISEHEPKAIGVAIDFSPDKKGYIHPNDPEFFQFCLDVKQNKGVPIFLGIYRSLGLPVEKQLGDEKYQDLAANLLIPHDVGGSSRMSGETQEEDERARGRLAAASKPGRSLSVALADSYSPQPGDSSGWFRRLSGAVVDTLSNKGFIEKTFERRLGPGLTVTEFLVDFSQLSPIEASTIRTLNPVVLRDRIMRERFEGKVVLIGDATPGEETYLFAVPGRSRPYPSIFLHACAAYTLIQASLYEVTGAGRFWIDIFFFLAILTAVILIRLYYKNRTPAKGLTHRLQGIFTLLVVIAALITGVLFVLTTRVMWDDFLLAPVVMIFHPSLEHRLENFWGRLKKQAAARLFIKRNGDSP